jgi:PAS domain S-box-containing protein
MTRAARVTRFRGLSTLSSQILARTPLLLTQCSSDLRYLFVNDAFAQMLKREPKDLIGKYIFDIMDQKGFTTILPHIKNVLKGRRVEFEADLQFKEVGARFLRVSCLPDQNTLGRVNSWVASIIDITDQKRAEITLAKDLHAMKLLHELGSLFNRQEAQFDECIQRVVDAALIITGAQKGALQLLDAKSGSLL